MLLSPEDGFDVVGVVEEVDTVEVVGALVGPTVVVGDNIVVVIMLEDVEMEGVEIEDVEIEDVEIEDVETEDEVLCVFEDGEAVVAGLLVEVDVAGLLVEVDVGVDPGLSVEDMTPVPVRYCIGAGKLNLCTVVVLYDESMVK